MSIATFSHQEQSSFLLSSLQAPLINVKAVDIHCTIQEEMLSNRTDATCHVLREHVFGDKQKETCFSKNYAAIEFCIFPSIGRWQEIPQQNRLSAPQFPDLPKH